MKRSMVAVFTFGFLLIPGLAVAQDRSSANAPDRAVEGPAAGTDLQAALPNAGGARKSARSEPTAKPKSGGQAAVPVPRTPGGPAALLPEAKRQLEALRDKVNGGIVGIMAGGIDGTYLRAATDLAAVLDDADGNGLRIFPIAGKGSLQNIWDIVFARGVDIGFVQSDVLTYAKRENLFPGIDSFIQYITSLYDEEVHILARSDIKTMDDLLYKKVNFDNRGSGSYMTANVLFSALNIQVEATTYDQALALEKLKQGEISAMVYVAGKPARLFSDLGPESGLHFLALPSNPELQKTYQSTRLTAADYPNLMREGETVDTLAVGAVMAVYAWPPESERYRKVARFVDAFFSHAATLQQTPRHPKWHEISLAAPLPGWTRFAAAEKWLRTAAVAGGDERQRQEFEAFLRMTKPGGVASPEERETLYAQYVQWRGERGSAGATSSDQTPGGEPTAGSDSASEPRGATSLPLASDTVKQIQTSLKAANLYNGPVDGTMGPQTKRAVLAYQEREGLPKTGLLDLQTLRRLTAARQKAAEGGG